MSRNVLAGIVTAMSQPTFKPLYMAEFAFDSGDLNLWNGFGTRIINSISYTGAGSLLTLSSAEETSEVAARGMEIKLSGIPQSLVALALAEPFQGRSCTVRMGYEGSNDTVILFSGLLDEMNIEETGETAVISVMVENELAALDRKVNWLYSDANHKSRHPTDEFFNFVTESDETVNWGTAAKTPTPSIFVRSEDFEVGGR